MRTLSHTLLYEIEGMETPKKIAIPKINYESLVARQYEVIKKLQVEIKYLQQYILYFAGEEQVEDQKELQTDSSLKNEEEGNRTEIANENKADKLVNLEKKRNKSLKSLLKQIMSIIEVQKVEEILQKLKIINQKANRKIQPIFIERIKYKEVPVPIEVIKQIEKQVIVYRDKIVEVPIFKQKIVQRYVAKPPQPEQSISQLSSAQNLQSINNSGNNSIISNCIQEVKENQVREEEMMKKKFNFYEPPKLNQTFNVKSPRYREKEGNIEKFNNLNCTRSPKYRQKDGF